MKQGIHPNYVECTVRCTCGNTFKTRSTKPELVIDLCDKCHPFYTGQQKLVDTGGRVQRFANKFGGAAQARLDAEKAAKAAKAAKVAELEAARKAAKEAKAAKKAKRAAVYAKKAEAEAAKAVKQAAEAPAEPEAAAEAPAAE
ncbi:MAG: 50S ribosomal protein L31 [Olsenella sp.]|jgi:large subunit ribosomal protein L31|nr:50S ribosomal protein L31 [Olsenella sp.]MCH3955866.1 50S ribosomal protein L31 [Olsenella sp.]MCI1645755.1 50S ribosomal protein L31 [Olsenella sp.]MCI1666938.1 50S ribosomal protein L31 [Olsenella sp.]MCI1794079.1 50S ribosomal protein L31 [Olsenella sp.]